MSYFFILLLFSPILIFIGYIIKLTVDTSNKSGTKFMLLGISIMLVGGILLMIVQTPYLGKSTYFEYLIVFIGTVFSITGFMKDN